MRSSEPLFHVPPFPAFPSTSRYVALGPIEEALTRVSRSIEAREGTSLVIGPPGTGKSLLSAMLAAHFVETHDVVVLGEAAIGDPAAFLRHLLHKLGVDLKGTSDNDLQLSLADHVCAEHSAEAGLLVILDEAQSLSPEVLEAIRMATNIMRRGEPRVCTVLCGGTKLDDMLASPAMQSLTQRVATRCYLHPMNADETRQYIHESIRRCGADPAETISEDAVAAVHHACSGVPRLVNHMMTQAIDCAEAVGQTLISSQIVDRAWAQLQQLPGPMLEEPPLAQRGSPVEFGELSEFGELNEVGKIQPTDAAASAELALAEAESGIAEAEAGIAETESVSQVFSAEETDLKSIDFDQLGSEGCHFAACEAESAQPRENSLRMFETTPKTDDAETPSEWGDLSARLETTSEIVICDSSSTTAHEDASDAGETEPMFEAGSDNAETHQPPLSLHTLASTTPLPALLFGEDLYDDEEDLTIGAGPAKPIAVSMRSDEPAEPAKDLEPTLHEEIIELASITSGAQPTQSPTAETLRFEGAETIPAPVLWLTETEDGRLIRDDSDLLIVEDDVPSDRAVRTKQKNERAEAISVDFQAMLEKMRAGG